MTDVNSPLGRRRTPSAQPILRTFERLWTVLGALSVGWPGRKDSESPDASQGKYVLAHSRSHRPHPHLSPASPNPPPRTYTTVPHVPPRLRDKPCFRGGTGLSIEACLGRAQP